MNFGYFWVFWRIFSGILVYHYPSGRPCLFKSFVERRPLLKHPCDGLCFSNLSSKRNRKFKHLVQTKPMGENTITNIMKVSVAGTSLKESEKKVCESSCKKNNSQQVEESNDCKFRTYRQCHRPQRYKFP